MSSQPAPRGDAEPALQPGPPAAAPDRQLAARLEALLVVADGPLHTTAIAAGLQVPEPQVQEALQTLADEYDRQQRGFRLRAGAAGWRLFAAPEHREAVQHIVLDEQPARLTQAALETLAVVAYRQPVTRSRVAAVRGVSVDAVMRTLVQRGLIREAGPEEGTGAMRYGTTELFLDRLGIAGLDELPELAPLFPDVSPDDDLQPARGPGGPGPAGHLRPGEPDTPDGAAGEPGPADTGGPHAAP